MVKKSYDSIPSTEKHEHVKPKSIIIATPHHTKSPCPNSNETSNVNFDMSMGWKKALLGIMLYLILGVIAYSFVFEKWNIEDSLYFSIVTFTTIGYGDLLPTNTASQLFTCVFIYFGVIFIAYCLGELSAELIEREIIAFDQTRNHISNALLVADDKTVKEGNALEKTQKSWKSYFNLKEKFHDWRPRLMILLSVVPIILAGAFFIGCEEGWSWSQSIYFAVVTSATVGYGDLSPEGNFLRIFSCFYILFTAGTMGTFIGFIIDSCLDRKRQKILNYFHSEKLQWKDIKVMDLDDNDTISKYEYMAYMLTSLNLVDEHILEELNARFNTLDANNDGVLTIEDMKNKAHTMMDNVKNEIERTVSVHFQEEMDIV